MNDHVNGTMAGILNNVMPKGNCSCVPGQYECGNCRRKRRADAYRRLTPAQKAYDRHVDPIGAYHTDFPSGCSCHISAPCSYCVEYNPDANKAL